MLLQQLLVPLLLALALALAFPLSLLALPTWGGGGLRAALQGAAQTPAGRETQASRALAAPPTMTPCLAASVWAARQGGGS